MRPVTGFEPPADSTGKQGTPPQSGAESGALTGETPADLAEVVRAWPRLPTDVQANILAMVRAVK
jgi:hypothetical protein